MEEKIIDGVNVSECKYYVTYTKDCINDNKSYNKCESYKDCYYKQIKRLEQENEELKNILKDIDKKLELALDVEQTDAEESFDLLYEIQEIITGAIGE